VEERKKERKKEKWKTGMQTEPLMGRRERERGKRGEAGSSFSAINAKKANLLQEECWSLPGKSKCSKLGYHRKITRGATGNCRQ